MRLTLLQLEFSKNRIKSIYGRIFRPHSLRHRALSDGADSRCRYFPVYQSRLQDRPRPARYARWKRRCAGDRTIFLATQHDATVDEPEARTDLQRRHARAAFCNRRNRTTGRSRSSSKAASARRPFASKNDNGAFTALVRRVPSVNEEGLRAERSFRRSTSWSNNICALSPDAQTDALQTALRNLGPVADGRCASSQLRISVEDKQRLLEIFSDAGAPAAIDRDPRDRARETTARPHHPDARQATDGEAAERVLPQRADQGDPQGAWAQGREGRARGIKEKDRGSRDD